LAGFNEFFIISIPENQESGVCMLMDVRFFVKWDAFAVDRFRNWFIYENRTHRC